MSDNGNPDATWDLITGDCRVTMSGRGRFDMIIADPPYGDTSLGWDNRVSGWEAEAATCLNPDTQQHQMIEYHSPILQVLENFPYAQQLEIRMLENVLHARCYLRDHLQWRLVRLGSQDARS